MMRNLFLFVFCLGIVWGQVGYGAEPTYAELKERTPNSCER